MGVVVAYSTVHFSKQRDVGNALACVLEASNDVGNFFAYSGGAGCLSVCAAEHGNGGVIGSHAGEGGNDGI